MQTNNPELAKALEIASKISYADLIKTGKITVEHLWMLLAKQLFKGKPNIPEDQYREMRKAFYCGFSECFRLVTDLSSDIPDEEEAAKVLGGIARETNAFFDANIEDILGIKKGQRKQ